MLGSYSIPGKAADIEVPRAESYHAKKKKKVKKRVKDIAKDLIRLYARRREAKGFAFSTDSYLQVELESDPGVQRPIERSHSNRRAHLPLLST